MKDSAYTNTPVMHILLVEDKPGDVVLMREAIKEVPYTIQLHVASDGEQALALLGKPGLSQHVPHPDLIFLDLNLPLKSGFEVMAALKHDPQLKFIPVVVLTSIAGTREMSRCYHLGARAYLVKPMGLDDYLSLVRTAIEFWSACKLRELAG